MRTAPAHAPDPAPAPADEAMPTAVSIEAGGPLDAQAARPGAMPKIGVVILNYNGWQDTMACAESLLEGDVAPAWLVIVDNASGNDSVERLRQWGRTLAGAFPGGRRLELVELDEARAATAPPAPLVLLRRRQNGGYAAGMNAGIRPLLRWGADAVWLLNNDTIVEKQALGAMARRLFSKPRPGLCGSLVRYLDTGRVQCRAGGRTNKWSGLSVLNGRGLSLEKARQSAAEDVEAGLDFIYGASVMASRDFICTVGLLDERYFLYCEEQDWAYSAAGRFDLAYAPDAVIWHKEGASTGFSHAAFNPRRLYNLLRSRLLLTARHTPAALPTVCAGIAFAAARMVWRRCGKRPKKFLGALLASKDNMRALHELALRRRQPQARRTALMVEECFELPEIDLTVVLYNSEKWLDAFFASLCAQRYPLSKIHLHIVDNGSTDASADRAAGFISRVSGKFKRATLTRQANVGFGRGHDAAIRQGSSEYILVTNVDLEFTPDAIVSVVRTALADTGGSVGSWELRQAPYEHPKHYDPVTLETNWSSCACILFRRAAYETAGGFCHSLFMYCEDVELSYRLRSHGYILKYVPQALVYHHARNGEKQPYTQYVGAIIGNIYIRRYYGKFRDKLSVPLIFLSVLRENCINRKKALKEIFAALLRMKKPPRGSARAFYPLRGVDYELARAGADYADSPAGDHAALPLISVIVRTYAGRGFLLEEALFSLANQTYKNLEVIVVEDGGASQQATVENFMRTSGARLNIRYIPNEKIGRAATGNVALAAATGDFLMFFDDDDLLYADHIETLYRQLRRSNADLAYAPGLNIASNIDISSQCYSEEEYGRVRELEQEYEYNILMNRNYILVHALFDRRLYAERGGFDTRLEYLEDWNLWMRYAKNHIFCYVGKTTALYRTPAAKAALVNRQQKLDEAKMLAKEYVRKGQIPLLQQG